MIRRKIQNYIAQAVEKTTAEVESPVFSVSSPDVPEHGDYSSNVALLLGKILNKNPCEVAKSLANILQKESDFFKDVSVAGPGFLNFQLAPEALTLEFKEILQKKSSYGAPRQAQGKTPRLARGREKINVEFISANPTGPLTMANGRGGFLGDTLSRVLETMGNKVEREYYVNDTGNQIITLGKSLLAALGLLPDEETFYKGEYVKEWAEKHLALVKRNPKNTLKLGQLAAKDFLAAIKHTIEKKAHIHFDRYTSEERHIHQKGFVKKALAAFKKAGAVYEKDGAVWLKTRDFGDDKDRVLVTSEGFPTYFLADAGHYLETTGRRFERTINILGPDHYGYVKRIQAAARILGVKNSEMIVMQAVRVVQNGEEVKMSKRKGTFLTFEEVVDEVGVDAARYFFIEKSPDTHMDFDLGLAKERSMKNPVYYIQYAHARIEQIFAKAGKTKPAKNPDVTVLTEPEEQDLLKGLFRYPEVVEDTAKDYGVHRLPRFTLELARAFHLFYERQRVITNDKELSSQRLALLLATKIVLKNTLGLMGISAPKRM